MRLDAYLQENILKPMGVTMFRAGDIYGYCGFTTEGDSALLRLRQCLLMI